MNKIKSRNTCLYRNKFSLFSESKSKLNVTRIDSRIVWHFAAMLHFCSQFETNTKRTQPIFELDFHFDFWPVARRQQSFQRWKFKIVFYVGIDANERMLLSSPLESVPRLNMFSRASSKWGIKISSTPNAPAPSPVVWPLVVRCLNMCIPWLLKSHYTTTQ